MPSQFIRIDVDDQANTTTTGWFDAGFASMNMEERPYAYIVKLPGHTCWLFSEHSLNEMQQRFFAEIAIESDNWKHIDLGDKS